MIIPAIIPAIIYFLIGSFIIYSAYILGKETDYSQWRSARGIITDIRTRTLGADRKFRNSAPIIVVEFNVDNHLYKGTSQELGSRHRPENFVLAREKYIIGESVDFKYNSLHESKMSQMFIKIFGREPDVPIRIEDYEFIKDKRGLYFLYAFGAAWIVFALIALVKYVG